MIWDFNEWNTAYGVSLAMGVASEVLEDAELEVQGYVTTAAWSDATADEPTNEIAFRKIRRAIGDLAAYFARQRNLIAPVAETYSESYAGVVSYSLSSGRTSLGASMTKASILAELSAYAATSSGFTPCATWGTGRFVGTLTVTNEDDE